MAYIVSDREIDITDPNALHVFSDGKPISWIINCAAYTAVDKAEPEPDLAFNINAAGPRYIPKTAKLLGAKLIHISTDYVFHGTKTGAYVETDIPNPLGIYGRTKYQGEVNIAQTLSEFFVIHTAWLFGRRGSSFVYTILRLFEERDEVRVVGDQWGSPTNAPDLAAVALEMFPLILLPMESITSRTMGWPAGTTLPAKFTV